MNTKISKVEDKISNVSGLVKKTDYDTKITDSEGKYFTTSDYKRFTSDILNAKIKQKELVNKSDISNLAKNFEPEILTTKAELKREKNKIMRL